MPAAKQRKNHSPMWLIGVAETIGNGPHLDFNCFMDAIAAEASEQGVKLIVKRKKLLQTSLAFRGRSRRTGG